MSRIEELIALAKDATPEERVLFERKLGVVLPSGDDPGSREWGYVCTGCGDLALEFVGSDQPEMSRPTAQLAWVQDPDSGARYRSASKDRPICMSCSRAIVLRAQSFAYGTRWKPDDDPAKTPGCLVNIDLWRRTKEEAVVEAQKVLAMRRGTPDGAGQAMGQVTDPDRENLTNRELIAAIHGSSEKFTGRSAEDIHQAVEVANQRYGYLGQLGLKDRG